MLHNTILCNAISSSEANIYQLLKKLLDISRRRKALLKIAKLLQSTANLIKLKYSNN